MNKDKEIRVKVDGGYLVAMRNEDPDFDGISIIFETDNGDIVDVVLIECKEENDRKKIDVYCYEEVHTEDWTSKFTLATSEITEATSN